MFTAAIPLGLAAVLLGSQMASAQNFRGKFQEESGITHIGTLVDSNIEGIVIQLEEGPRSGQFSPRIAWESLDTETLMQLVRQPEIRDRVRFFIPSFNGMVTSSSDLDAVYGDLLDPPKEIIRLQALPPSEFSRTSWLSGWLGSTGGLGLLALLVLGSAFAGREVGYYRHWPKGWATLLGAVPIVGPILIFLLRPPSKAA